MSENGVHRHTTFDLARNMTSIDGVHAHTFVLSSGAKVESSTGGAHAHALYDGSCNGCYGGAHVHTVVLDGIELKTEMDGYHSHDLLGSQTTEGGTHRHAIVLPGDVTITSEFAAPHAMLIASTKDIASVEKAAEHLLEVVQLAVWSTKYVNDLPDASFMFIESGGEKAEDGKTTPRSLRHFPIKDADGNIDLPHLRNAIARIPQSNAPGLTDSKKKTLQEQARKLLEAEQKKVKTKKLVGNAPEGDWSALEVDDLNAARALR